MRRWRRSRLSTCAAPRQASPPSSRSPLSSQSIFRKQPRSLRQPRAVSAATKFVKFDPRFRPVFESVFGDILVVENLDVARRFGIGAAKMVTLEGDFADISGTMKGGYHAKRRQGLGFKEAQMDKELETLAAHLAYSEAQ